MKLLLSIFFIVSSPVVGWSEGTTGATVSKVPVFTVQELLFPTQAVDFKLGSILTTTGLLSVSLPRQDHLDVLLDLCDCQDLVLNAEGTDVAILDDGVTVRSTLATATVGTKTPLPLPPLPQCGKATRQHLEQVRDHVATASHAFTVALDRILKISSSGRAQALLHDDIQNKVYSTVSGILTSANHLEHFHVYEKKRASSSKSLEWHTDAGLFLAFVPGQDCFSADHQDNDDAFWFQNEQGEQLKAVFAPNSVTMMLGSGAQHWISSDIQLQATKHAVQMRAGSKRVWYGMMHMVPESAIIQRNPTKTFADMRANMLLKGSKPKTFGDSSDEDEVISIGCGSDHEVYSDGIGSTTTSRRRRLQHAVDPSSCNNSTNFFCWMTCLDIPNANKRETYVKDGYSLYCLDPAVLASSGNDVSQAMEPCISDHNSNCVGSWQPTVSGLEPSADIQVEYVEPTNQPYCYGGTSMYMDGFHWVHATTCVIYLFPQWVLSTRGKLAGAAVGTLLLGVLLEFAIMQRRAVLTSLKAGYNRLAAAALFYGLQLTLGYFLMLVVMTYSGVLFFCTILGVVIGHVLFNAKDALLGPKSKASTNNESSAMPTEKTCCLNRGLSTTSKYTKPALDVENSEGEDGALQESALNDDSNQGIPEGITPCCQHVL